MDFKKGDIVSVECEVLSDFGGMDFKKGDIVSVECEVLSDFGGNVQARRTGEWKLIKRPLDLAKPVRFAPGALENIPEDGL